MRMIIPQFLKQGDRVFVCCPSYRMDYSDLQKGLRILQDRGLEVEVSPLVKETYLEQYCAAASERRKELIWAFKEPSIKAIIAARGGYGAVQLLDSELIEAMRSNPKWLVGYSDITLLHFALLKAGVCSLHAPMLSSFVREESERDMESERRTFDTLFGFSSLLEWTSQGGFSTQGVRSPKDSIELTGTLIGGNMASFTPLLGSSFDPFQKDGSYILFIEEIEETARNIDRMMHSIAMHLPKSSIKAIVCGEFTLCGDEFGLGSIEKLLHDHTLPSLGWDDIPVICSLPCGHGKKNLPLVQGAEYRLRSESSTLKSSLSLLEDSFRNSTGPFRG